MSRVMLLSIGILLLLVQTGKGDNSLVDNLFLRRAEDYKLFDWRGRTEFKYGKTINLMDLNQIALPALGLKLAHKTWTRKNMTTMFWLTSDGQIALRIELYLLNDTVTAHEEIVRIFSGMMSTQLFTECTGLGDRAFYMQHACLKYVVFARNNITVSIKSKSDKIDPLVIAKQIDKEILKQSNVDVNQPTTVKHCNVKDD